MTALAGTRPWLAPVPAAAQDAPLLLCFPHAGGTAAGYSPWVAGLAPAVAVLPVHYPGRLDRRAEAAPGDLVGLAGAVAEVVAPLVGEHRVLLFGHSMGAVVAYEVARALTAGGAAPAALVVSGRRPPHLPVGERLPTDEEGVLADVRRLGGRGTALLEDPELRAAFLPAIRADYALLDAYRHREGAPLPVPLTAIVGDADERVSPAQAREWAALTSASFELLVRPGGHFYLDRDQAFLFALLRSRAVGPGDAPRGATP